MMIKAIDRPLPRDQRHGVRAIQFILNHSERGMISSILTSLKFRKKLSLH